MIYKSRDIEKIPNTSYKVLDYFNHYFNFSIQESDIKFIDNSLIDLNKLSFIINLYRVNDIRYINKYFEKINSKLSKGNVFICCVETFNARKRKKYIYNIFFLGFIYNVLEFIFLRIIPKIKILRYFYFLITNGKNRILSKAETLGRLVSCGFDIIDYKSIGGILYIVSKKKSEPKFDMNPSYGLIYKMPRVGKNKKIIYVYKIRTMHPYSEYLQEYIFEKNGTTNGDKIINDFRISKIGKFFRKYWIDELPMLINLFNGDLKLIGVRPLSKVKFNMYPKEAQKLRTRYKPGLIPPFYADLPKNFDELVESELNYLKHYSKSPIFTDLKYFFMCFKNIIFKKARSK